MTVSSLLLAILLATPATEQAQRAAADSSPPPTVARVAKPPSADTTADTTFYITNRARKRGVLQREFADSLEFGVIVSKVITGTSRAPLDQLVGRVTIRAADSTLLSRAEFASRLHAADSVAGETVMYVHGYATSFARGMTQVTERQEIRVTGGAMAHGDTGRRENLRSVRLLDAYEITTWFARDTGLQLILMPGRPPIYMQRLPIERS